MSSASSVVGRVSYIDALRGFAILLVVLGHAIQYSVVDYDAQPVFRLIYAFHMPLFMFISGFVYHHDSRNPWPFLRKKLQFLVLPFFSWLLVSFLWFHTINAHNAIEFLLGVFKSPDAGGLWFLWVLFLIYIVMAFSQAVAPGRAITVALGFYIILNLIVLKVPSANVLGLGLLCWHLLFFLLGHAWAQRLPRNVPSLGLAVISALIFVIFMSIWQRNGNNVLEGYFSNLPHIAQAILVRGYNYVTALSAIIALMGFFRIITEEFGESLTKLRFLGSVTLEIYATHIYFLSAVILLTAQYSLGLLPRVILVFSGALIGALYFQKVIKKIPVLALLMFGRYMPKVGLR
jgi:fucose 4-O-acetylase-like acetyltransferase